MKKSSDELIPFTLATYIRAKAELDDQVSRIYPVGRQLEWTRGPLKGRMCRVRHVIWETTATSLKIFISVETYSKRMDRDIINNNDVLHRTAHPESWFK